MYQNKSICAIITARAGSKGIKDKNLYPVNGKPLINYTIDAAKQSKYLDAIYCTTDGVNIKEDCLNEGINVINRPPELALDTSKSIDCVIHAIEEMKKQGKHFDYILLLQPTSPLRQSFHIDGIIKECIDKDLGQMLSVHQVKYNPILVRWQKEETLTNVLTQQSTVRRQDMPKAVYINGMLYLSKTELLSLDTSLNDIPYGFEVDSKYTLDINDMIDIQLAEAQLKEL